MRGSKGGIGTRKQGDLRLGKKDKKAHRVTLRTEDKEKGGNDGDTVAQRRREGGRGQVGMR